MCPNKFLGGKKPLLFTRPLQPFRGIRLSRVRFLKKQVHLSLQARVGGPGVKGGPPKGGPLLTIGFTLDVDFPGPSFGT